MTVVTRDYGDTYKKFTALGPLMTKIGNGGKGIAWNTEDEVKQLAELNYTVTEDGVAKGLPKIESAIDACEVILMLAPETNGQVAVKAWEALSKITGRDHTHLAIPREDDKIRFRDVVAQPRKIISSPTWSGLESEHVSYNAGYTNVHELIPWRTLTGRQQFYQDHQWMLDFGEGLCVYKPPVDTKTIAPMLGKTAERQPRAGAQLDHPAPEVGHPQHLHRQPAHADAVARRPPRLGVRDRRRSRPGWSTTTGSRCSTSTAR